MPCSLFAQRYALQNFRNRIYEIGLSALGVDHESYIRLRGDAYKLTHGLGIKMPSVSRIVLKLFGLSPGTLTVFLDSDSGFFAEARATPGARAFYHHISDTEAMSIFNGEMTPELHDHLFTPDDYEGE